MLLLEKIKKNKTQLIALPSNPSFQRFNCTFMYSFIENIFLGVDVKRFRAISVIYFGQFLYMHTEELLMKNKYRLININCCYQLSYILFKLTVTAYSVRFIELAVCVFIFQDK